MDGKKERKNFDGIYVSCSGSVKTRKGLDDDVIRTN